MVSTWVCAKGAGRDQGRSQGQAYLLATYFAITTVSTIGYGDISPQLNNDTEVRSDSTYSAVVLCGAVPGLHTHSHTHTNTHRTLARQQQPTSRTAAHHTMRAPI